ncbi:hypothetical protein F0562_024001 [Nyssa sinensis]|uniref:Uncharacterized protein n=1 Tax=Nyssa sinensis TaxID=561372 RepID=A0A5J5BJ92_9ASTE|nr:hypothetical protein F0562_024001 [Nyssa sinensis]
MNGSAGLRTNGLDSMVDRCSHLPVVVRYRVERKQPTEKGKERLGQQAANQKEWKKPWQLRTEVNIRNCVGNVSGLRQDGMVVQIGVYEYWVSVMGFWQSCRN